MWCKNNFEDDEFMETYERLRDQKIGVDLLEKIKVSNLMKECNITLGTAVRMTTSLSDWLDTLSN